MTLNMNVDVSLTIITLSLLAETREERLADKDVSSGP